MPPDEKPPEGATTPTVETTPAAPVVAETPPAAAPASPEPTPAPVVDKPVEPAAPIADAAPADKAKPDFAPSLLDEAGKPAAEPVKPAEPASDKKDDAAKPDDGKPPAPKEPAPAPEAPAPIEYAFKYPDGFKPEEIDAERMGAFTGILAESRVTPESGQKLMDLHVAELGRASQAIEGALSQRQWDVFNNTQKQWRDDAMADPEIGGSRHETALRTVMGLVDAYGNRHQGTKQARDADAIAAERKELMDVFRVTGAANNRLVLGLLHFAGEKLREGTPRPAPPPRSPAPNAQNRGVNRYRNTTSG